MENLLLQQKTKKTAINILYDYRLFKDDMIISKYSKRKGKKRAKKALELGNIKAYKTVFSEIKGVKKMLYVLDIEYNQMIATAASSKEEAFKIFKEKYPHLAEGEEKYIKEVPSGSAVFFSSSSALGKKIL